MSDRPAVRYACIHNSWRSVAAQVLTRHYADDAIEGRSADSEPCTGVNLVVAQVLADRGLPVSDHMPPKLDQDLVEGADAVITMGFGRRTQYSRASVRGLARRGPRPADLTTGTPVPH